MATRIAEHMEPLPGYELIERLGSGGFGEVWKTQAPGGLFKAIKFVHGQLAEGDITALQEFKALQRVKDMHHPFILTLERVDIVEGQLVIVMELADRNLWDRFQQCREQGLPGIPRAELLLYLTEAAKALDVMNHEYQIQHLDIKPQNIFLVRKHVKVADFGLAKDLEGTHANLTSGITPVYAAPETFEGRVSHFCDQYSLAIVYQEMLTGIGPFNGKNARQLLMQHLKADPDLTSLPAGDRAAVARSLAKTPTERFPSCTEFVGALTANKDGTLPAPSTSAKSGVMPRLSASPEVRWPVISPRPVCPTPAPSLPAPARSAPTRRDLIDEETVPFGDAAKSKKSKEQAAKKLSAKEPAPKKAISKEPAPKKKIVAEPAVRKCPRCGADVKKRASLGWCAKCGYCPSLGDEGPPPRLFPAWLAITLALAVGVVGALFLMR